LVIKTKSNSISAPENATEKQMKSTNIAQCHHLTLRWEYTGGRAFK